jgi:hypothetical protein
MKKFKILLVFAAFFMLANFPANANGFPPGGGGNSGGGKGGPVGAPLDGGLLTILGAAGVTYYLVRKNKKNKE